MNSSVKVVPLERVTAPVLAVIVNELTSKRLPKSLSALDTATGRALSRLVRMGDFSGKRDEVAVAYPTKRPKRVVLVGLGTQIEMTRGAVRRATAVAARRATQLEAESLALFLTPEGRGGVSAEVVGQMLIEGAVQGSWQFTDLKSEEATTLEAVQIIAPREDRTAIEHGRRIGAAIASGHVLARNLQALPGNVCTPRYLTGIARKLGKAYEHRVTVLGRTQIEKAEMRALLAVAQGSEQEPQFIILQYKGGGRSSPVCVIGKGITFDSGGISIKPSDKMEEMKYDMSGAAAVLGLFEVLGQLKPKVNVVGLIPASENLPSGTAIKPGDIVRGMLGKTIEIINTDAEGRLILCDALAYARRFKPACVIDAATLTGSVVIALGHHATGLMGNDDPLVEEVRRAGDLAGERCWPLPLWDEYREQLKSDVADIKNVGGRPAGTLTAGWFLREFVDGFPWAHLDIAGSAWTDSDRPDLAKGPTGTGVRLFAEFVLGRAKE